MKTIFLAHSFEDQKAREIAWALRGKCERSGFNLITAFEMPFGIGTEVIASIFEQLKKASVVVAVVNERRSNVLLELGYALGMGKAVILVADLNNSLPFDLSLIQAVDYRSPTDEIAIKLMRAIGKLLEEDRFIETELPHELEEMLRLRAEYPEKFEQISAYEFERAVRNAFLKKGYQVQDVNLAQNCGFDFRVSKEGAMSLVEVKKNSPNGKVSIAAVQQLLGAIHAHDAPKALLICTSDFTDSARGFAGRYATKLTLWTVDDLVKFLEGKTKI